MNCLDNTAKMRRSPDATRRLVDGTDTDHRKMCGLKQVGPRPTIKVHNINIVSHAYLTCRQQDFYC